MAERLIQTVLLLVGTLGICLVLLCGCNGAPQLGSTVTPTSTASLETVAERIDRLDQKVTQIQVTVTQQTQNFSLDTQRAKVESERNKNLMKFGTAGFLSMLGLILLALCTGEFATGKVKAMLVIVAICLLCAPALLLVWPF